MVSRRLQDAGALGSDYVPAAERTDLIVREAQRRFSDAGGDAQAAAEEADRSLGRYLDRLPTAQEAVDYHLSTSAPPYPHPFLVTSPELSVDTGGHGPRCLFIAACRLLLRKLSPALICETVSVPQPCSSAVGCRALAAEPRGESCAAMPGDREAEVRVLAEAGDSAWASATVLMLRSWRHRHTQCLQSFCKACSERSHEDLTCVGMAVGSSARLRSSHHRGCGVESHEVPAQVHTCGTRRPRGATR